MRGRAFRSLFVVGASVAALALVVPACRADDGNPTGTPAPAPTPVVFGRAQYLVWMESHGTSNGPVTDNAYWLYTQPPDENGYFRVPDGDGGTFTYVGQLVSGPYLDDTTLCPDMLARGIRSLSAWPPGQYAAYVDCSRFRPQDAATISPVGTAPVPGDGPLGGWAWPLGLAGAVAAGVGGVILVGTRVLGPGSVPVGPAGPAPTPATEPPPAPEPSRPPADEQRPKDPDRTQPPDPCAALELDLRHLVDGAHAVQRSLEMERSTVAQLEAQIDRVAKLTIPMGVTVDAGFVLLSMAGAQPGATLAAYSGSALAKAAITATLKEILKSAVKGGIDMYGDGDITRLADLATRGGQAALRGELKELIVRALMNDQLGAGTSLRPPVTSSVAAGGPAYRAAIDRLAEAQAAAKPMAEALTSVLSLVNTTMGTRDQMAALDTLRQARNGLLDQIANQEVRQESFLEDARFARDRLNHCREINAPGWRP